MPACPPKAGKPAGRAETNLALAGLNCRRGNPTGGSNPPLSAKYTGCSPVCAGVSASALEAGSAAQSSLKIIFGV